MINIDEFKVDKVILLISILRKEKGMVAKYLSNPKLRKLRYVVETFTNHPERYKSIIDDTDLMCTLETEFFESKKFEEIYAETKKYKEHVEEKWNVQKSIIQDYFENSLGLDKDLSVVVNIVNPRWNTGTNDGKREIFWGSRVNYSEDVIWYDSTYLVHEALHCYFPYQKEWNNQQLNVCHSLIQLASDNELGRRLGNVDFGYGAIGHDGTQETMKKLLPIWNSFLNMRESSIPYENDSLKGITNFNELMEYCIENYRDFSDVSKKTKDEYDI